MSILRILSRPYNVTALVPESPCSKLLHYKTLLLTTIEIGLRIEENIFLISLNVARFSRFDEMNQELSVLNVWYFEDLIKFFFCEHIVRYVLVRGILSNDL